MMFYATKQQIFITGWLMVCFFISWEGTKKCESFSTNSRQITKDQGWHTNTSFFKVTNNQYSDRPCWSKNCWTTCWLLSGWYTSLLVVLFQKITESVGGWKVIELYAKKRRLKLNYQYSSLKKKCLKCYCKCGEVWNAVINMSSTCHLFYPLKMLGAND